MNSLPLPERKQREVLYMPTKGHSVVLGTAGSGKTTLALYRAVFLSLEGFNHSGRVLLLSYNKALVNYLNNLRPEGLENIQIETYHKFARGYLHYRNKMGHDCILNDKRLVLTPSIEEIKQQYPTSPIFCRPAKFFEDEVAWIQGQGVKEQDYYQVERKGRNGTRLLKDQRPIMYKIFQTYLRQREGLGKKYDWDDLASYVKEEFNIDNGERMYKHIIVDEGQDFSPEMIRSLVRAIPFDGSLTFFGDVAQQIYGQRTSWRSAGLDVVHRPVWKFEENYRNTREIAALGLALSKMPYFQEIEDIVQPTFQANEGPKPTLVKYSNESKQIEICVNNAIKYSKDRTVAVLFKNHELKRRLEPFISSTATELKEEHYEIGDVGLFYGTYHSSKGLEFDMVILPFLDSDNLPDEEEVKAHGEEDAKTYFGRLLYVAITRAKSNLILLYTGHITPLLPQIDNLYKQIIR